MTSRLPIRPMQRCHSCSLRLLNSFTSACANPVKIQTHSRQSRIATIRHITNTAGRLGEVAGETVPQNAKQSSNRQGDSSKEDKGTVWKNLNYIQASSEVEGMKVGKSTRNFESSLKSGVSAENQTKPTIWKDLNYIHPSEGLAAPTRIIENVTTPQPGMKKIWKDLNYIHPSQGLAAPTRIIDNVTTPQPGMKKIWKELNYVKSDKQQSELGPITSQKSAGEEAGKPSQKVVEEVPWYLQETYVEKKSDLLPERPPLPPLPADPPELLEPILKYLDVELGLTDLRIMDLRPLDPAPAIGTDIIMVFATARSDKHLHSSGNKVCRWLRSQHKIHPFADGIIGRNEMKLINKRRRRRGKVAASQVGEENEQMHTEWVCINVGEGGLILQLFTPARRDELRLEALWERKLETNRLRQEKMVKAIEEGRQLSSEDIYGNEDEDFDYTEGFGPVEEMAYEETEHIEVEETEKTPKNKTAFRKFVNFEADTDDMARSRIAVEEFVEEVVEEVATETQPGEVDGSAVRYVPFKVGRISSSQSQTRSFHTTRTLDSNALNTAISIPPQLLNPKKLPSTYGDFLQILPQALQDDIEKGLHTLISRNFASYFSGQATPLQSVEQAAVLFAHVKHLQTLDTAAASTAIGESPLDTTSTPFLRSFFGEIPTIPQQVHYRAWLALLIQGNIINPAKYPASSFLSLAKQMKASGSDVPYQFYLTCLQAISTSPEFMQCNNPSDKTYARIREVSRKMKEMTNILEDMSRNSGYDITTPEIFTYLTTSLVHKDVPIYYNLAVNVCNMPSAASSLTSILSPNNVKKSRPHHAIDRRLLLLEELVEKKFHIAPTMPEHFSNQLVAFAMAGYWIAFWNRWNDMYLLGFSRGQEAYKLALGLMVLAGDQHEALIGMRKLKADMLKEVPGIELTEPLARGWLAVMMVAGGVDGWEGVGSEFHKLMKACLDVVNNGQGI